MVEVVVVVVEVAATVVVREKSMTNHKPLRNCSMQFLVVHHWASSLS